MKSYRNLFKLLLPVIFLVLFSIFLEFEKEEDLVIYFLDVGQGDSILIDAPNGQRVLIDAGRDEKVIEELEKIIPFWDKEIDLFIMSHGDLDHIGGFFEVLDRYKVNRVLKSFLKVDSKIQGDLIEKVQNQNIEIKKIGEGDLIILDQDSGIYLETYWPPKDINKFGDNETSLVLELIHGENEVLFTGDIGFETEHKLIEKYSEKINSDILKVGHHGSKNSTSQYFLDKVTPEFSILLYGENSYGHPHDEVLEKLEKSGGEIFHTKDRGTIVARSNDENMEIKYLPDVIPTKAGIQAFIKYLLGTGFLPAQE